jgi:hypothetical protein
MGASVRARLLNLAKERHQPFDLLLTRYVLERFLYRLGTTKHRQNFVLKGAMLITTWFDDPHRPTRDLDLLGFGDPDPEALLGVFRHICSLDAQDAVTFDEGRHTARRCGCGRRKGPPRLKTTATVDEAKVRDIWVLARSFEYEGDALARPIAATFARRDTEIPAERPDALTRAFAEDPLKQRQRDAFVSDVAFQPGTLGECRGCPG